MIVTSDKGMDQFVINQERECLVLEATIHRNWIPRHVGSFFPHGVYAPIDVRVVIIARVLPHHHRFPLIEDVRDRDRLLRVSSMNERIVYSHPIRKRVPVVFPIVQNGV